MFYRAKKETGMSSPKINMYIYIYIQFLLMEGKPTNLLQVFQNLFIYTLFSKEFLNTFNHIFNNRLVEFKLYVNLKN